MGPHGDRSFVPIDSYGAIGDFRSVALVARDGSVDWLPMPKLDSPPGLAAVLEPEGGGYVAIRPEGPFTTSRRYVAAGGVLETVFTTDEGKLKVTDALTLGPTGMLPWTELARAVEVVEGSVALRWEVVPGHRLNTARPWSWHQDGVARSRIQDQELVVAAEGLGPLEVDPERISGRITANAGQRGLLVVVVTDNEPVMAPDLGDVRRRIEDTTSMWRRWRSCITYDGPHADKVATSAAALRLLSQERSGALAAAATTALPEAIGGKRNFDYRYAWVRDAAFAVDALGRIGLRQEAHAVTSWLLSAVAETAPDLHVFYTLEGRPAPPTEETFESLEGYMGSKPVQTGNSAASQRQLGSYGHLLDAAWHYHRAGGQLSEGSGRLVSTLADETCDQWPWPDAGLWELGDYRQYTSSKIGCWTALDRAILLGEAGQIDDRHLDRWGYERDRIKRYVEEECFSKERSAYTFSAGSDQLDCAVLLAARTGFCPEGDERLGSTVAAIRRDLTAGGALLYRYSEVREKEGAFIACSFWLVEALVHLGQLEEAEEALDGALAVTNDLGLLSEEVDPQTGQLLGNFPQALSHLALIGAVTSLAEAGRNR